MPSSCMQKNNLLNVKQNVSKNIQCSTQLFYKPIAHQKQSIVIIFVHNPSNSMISQAPLLTPIKLYHCLMKIFHAKSHNFLEKGSTWRFCFLKVMNMTN